MLLFNDAPLFGVLVAEGLRALHGIFYYGFDTEYGLFDYITY